MSAEKFPPRILALLHEVADRVGTEFRGPFEDGNGDPLQDDADAAIAWIAAAEAGQEAAAVQAVGAWRPMSDFPPLGSVLMWNVTANRLYPAMSYRIGHPVLENCCDCSHWMPLPAPPAALSGSLGDGGGKG